MNSFNPGDPVVWQETLKAKVVRVKDDGDVIIAFGSGTDTRVVSPLTLRHARREDLKP